MTEDLHAVARGLRRVVTGLWLLVAAVVVGVVSRFVGAGPDLVFPFVGLIALIGSSVRLIGRVLCLRVPEDAITARARLRTGLVIEGCGLLSAVGNVVVALLWAGGLLPVPEPFLLASTGFSIVLLLAGRIFFLLYLDALTHFLGYRMTQDEVRSVLWLTGGVVGGIAGVIGLYLVVIQAGNARQINEFFVITSGLLVIGGPLVGLFLWFARYKALLEDIEGKVEHYIKTHPADTTNDPDASYRRRPPPGSE